MSLQRLAQSFVRNPRALQIYDQWALQAARDDFYVFRQQMHPDMKRNWFTASVAAELQQFYVDWRLGRRPILMLCTPPQHGKIMNIVEFISWVAGKHPDLAKIIYTSFAERLCRRANMWTQRLMSYDRYQALFPDTKLANRPGGLWERSVDMLSFVGHDGYFRATTIGGQITGEELALGFVDDPMKGREQANSKAMRDKVWEWLLDDLYTRFSEMAGLVVIMTRWNVDDPSGRLMEHFNKRVRVVLYPAIADKDSLFRKAGEALFPEHKSLDFLNLRRRSMTKASWESLYQQNPIIAGGDMFPIGRFKLINSFDRSKIVRSVRYWDKAGTKDGGAFSSGTLMHKMADSVFVIEDVKRGQWSISDRELMILQTARVDRASLKGRYEIVVEQEPGSGGKESAENTIKRLVGFVCSADRVTGDKVMRAEPYAAQVQNGNVYLLLGEWNRPFLDEHETFPNGKYKDQVDSSAGAFARCSRPGYDASMRWVGA